MQTNRFLTPPRPQRVIQTYSGEHAQFRQFLLDALQDCLYTQRFHLSTEHVLRILDIAINDENDNLRGEPRSAVLDSLKNMQAVVAAGEPLLCLRHPAQCVENIANQPLAEGPFDRWINDLFSAEEHLRTQLQAGRTVILAQLNRTVNNHLAQRPMNMNR